MHNKTMLKQQDTWWWCKAIDVAQSSSSPTPSVIRSTHLSCHLIDFVFAIACHVGGNMAGEFLITCCAGNIGFQFPISKP